jgi:hypothetical protein
MAICCQPDVAGGIIYAHLRGELSTHLALQALFTQSSPVRKPLLQAFPFPSTLAEVTLHRFLRPGCLFIAHVGSGPSPLSHKNSAIFLPPPLSQAFPLLVARHTLPLPPSPARPSLFIYSSVKDSPLPLFGAQGSPLSLQRVFIVLIAYYSVSLFFLGGWWVCPGGYADLAQGCLWEYHIPLSSPCGPCLPKPSGCGRLGVFWGLF